MKENVEECLNTGVPEHMKDLDQQNKKLRGFLKIYNNLLTKLIKKSNKADLLGTAKENTEFKHRSKDK